MHTLLHFFMCMDLSRFLLNEIIVMMRRDDDNNIDTFNYSEPFTFFLSLMISIISY